MTATCTSPPSGWELGGAVDWGSNGSEILVIGIDSGTSGLLEFSSSAPFSANASDWGQGTPVNVSPTQAVFAAQISPDGIELAVVAGTTASNAQLYVVPSSQLPGPLNLSATDELMSPSAACQVAWRPDAKELALMEPGVPCGPDAVGAIVAVNVNAGNLTSGSTIVPSGAANPAWQPTPGD
jgi:hypothetical protein